MIGVYDYTVILTYLSLLSASTGIIVCGFCAQQITGKGQGKRQFACSLGAAEHQRMGELVLPDHLEEMILHALLCYYLLESV